MLPEIEAEGTLPEWFVLNPEKRGMLYAGYRDCECKLTAKMMVVASHHRDTEKTATGRERQSYLSSTN